MKIRNGFVSNSSSSSFILYLIGKFATIEVARRLLTVRRKRFIIEDEFSEEDDIEHGDKILLERLEKFKKTTIYDNPNIYFSSTEYNTFITYVGGYIFIITANNCREFSDVLEDIRVYDKKSIPVEIKKYFDSRKSEIYDYIDLNTFDGDFDEYDLRRILVDNSIYYNLESECFENGKDMEY